MGPMRQEDQLDLTVVVPYFNPGRNLVAHVAQVIELLRERGVSFEVIAVSDGSTDGSDAGLEQLGPEVQVVHLAVNQGKGHALRVGSRARPRQLPRVHRRRRRHPGAGARASSSTASGSERPDFAIGSKRHAESVVVYPPLRRFYSWGYQVLTRLLFGLDITDTQSGIKLARREIVTELLPDPRGGRLHLRPRAPRRGTAPWLHTGHRAAGRDPRTILEHRLAPGGLGHARRHRAPHLAAADRTPLRPCIRRRLPGCQGFLGHAAALAASRCGQRSASRRSSATSPRA